MNNTNYHCCKQMQDLLDENKVAFGYAEKFRCYYIDLKTSSNAVQSIDFCPWCGVKLPAILSNKYAQELSKILKISLKNMNLKVYGNSNIPKEFKTDEWWKKRGL